MSENECSTVHENVLKDILKYIDLHFHKKQSMYNTNSLLLLGKSGMGKTHLLSCLLSQLPSSMNVLLINQQNKLFFDQKKFESELLLSILSLVSNSSNFMLVVAQSIDQLHKNIIDKNIISKHIYLPQLSENQRVSIFEYEIIDVNISSNMAAITNGYTVKNIKNICNQAKIKYYLRLEEEKEANTKIPLTLDDFGVNMSMLPASTSINTNFTANVNNHTNNNGFPTYEWDNIGGCFKAKKQLERAIYFWANKEKLKIFGQTPSNGILLHGPSGCSKTTLALGVTKFAKLHCIQVSARSLLRPYVGESELMVRKLFRQAAENSPAVIIFDQIEDLAATRNDEGADTGVGSRVLSTLLNEMDGIEKKAGVYVIGCTVNKDRVDAAILRPGRMDEIVELDYPNQAEREDILNVCIKKASVNIDPAVDKASLCNAICGYSPSDINKLVREACLFCAKSACDVVKVEHFNLARTEIEGP